MTKYYVYWGLWAPLCVQLAVLMLWNMEVISKRNDEPVEGQINYKIANRVCYWTLLVLSGYFILIELVQSSRDFKSYLSLQNLSDLAPNILIILACIKIMTAPGESGEEYPFWVLQAFGGLLLWIKFLLFLRVFEYTGHLIHMILEVVREMVPFIIVLFVSVAGFTESFHSLDKSLAEDEQSLTTLWAAWKYSFLLTLGEFGDNAEER